MYRLTSEQSVRRRTIVERRRAGDSFTDIAHALGVSRQAVHQLYYKHLDREHREGAHNGNYVQDCATCRTLAEYD